jgi:hypothetical protein
MAVYDIGLNAIIVTVVLVSFTFRVFIVRAEIVLGWPINQSVKPIMTNNFGKRMPFAIDWVGNLVLLILMALSRRVCTGRLSTI